MGETPQASDIAKQAITSVKDLLIRCSHSEYFLATVALQKLPGENGFLDGADFEGAYFALVREARHTVKLITGATDTSPTPTSDGGGE